MKPTFLSKATHRRLLKKKKYLSDRKLFHYEIQRVGQVLVDNDYPLYIVDSIIKNLLDKHVEGDLAESESDKIKLHVSLDPVVIP